MGLNDRHGAAAAHTATNPFFPKDPAAANYGAITPGIDFAALAPSVKSPPFSGHPGPMAVGPLAWAQNIEQTSFNWEDLELIREGWCDSHAPARRTQIAGR